MASMEDTSDCESLVGVFTLVKKHLDVLFPRIEKCKRTFERC